MKKRLLAGLMAFCLAAGAANAAFAEDPPLAPQDPAQSIEITEIATGETAATPVPSEMPPETDEATPEPTQLPAPRPAAAPTTPESAATPLPEPTALPVDLQTLTLTDNTATTGEFTAVVNGDANPAAGATYTWYRSKTGAADSWQKITGQAVSGDMWNLTTDRPQALNVALDTLLARSADPGAVDTDRYHYKVEVTAAGKTLTAEAQVAYYVQLQNGSFEYPVVSQNSADRSYFPFSQKRTHFLQTLHAGAKDHERICWYTTANCQRWGSNPGDAKGNYIEIADATTTSYNDSIIVGSQGGRDQWEYSTDANDVSVEYHIGSAYDGSQFAELNCQSYGALYQDVLTVPGATLNWSAAHAGRDGTDTMALIIAPVDAAAKIVETLATAANLDIKGAVAEALQGNIELNGESIPISRYIVNSALQAGQGKWTVHSGTYTVPPGQYLSRFFFVAVDTASTKEGQGGVRVPDLSGGNLLDRVWFSTDPVPPVAGSGSLQVTKTLLKADGTDWTAAELAKVKENLRFTLMNSDGNEAATFTGSEMQTDSARQNVLHYPLELPLTDSSGEPYRYALTETAKGETDDWTCTLVRTAGADGNWTEVTETPAHSGITLNTQTTTTVQFENTYARRAGSLTVTKQLPADADEALQTDFANTVNTFMVTGALQGSYTLQYSEGARPDDAPTTVTADGEGRVQVQIKGAGSVTLLGLAPGDYTIEETNAPDLTNYYRTTPAAEREKTAEVTAGQRAEVTFTNTYAPYLSVTITKKVTGNMGNTAKDFAFTATVENTQIKRGSADVTAGTGAALTDSGFTLRNGGSITLSHLRQGQDLTITETDPGEHTVTWQLNGDTTATGSQYTLTVPETPDAEITCINRRDVNIPTGLHSTVAPYLTLLGVCWLGWRLLRRREV